MHRDNIFDGQEELKNLTGPADTSGNANHKKRAEFRHNYNMKFKHCPQGRKDTLDVMGISNEGISSVENIQNLNIAGFSCSSKNH